MVQRSAPQSYYAESYFPVRVRVAVPPGGFGSQLNTIYGWLDQHVGRAGYWSGGGGRRALDTTMFYFLTVDSAKAFVDRFGCGLVVGIEPPLSAKN